MRLFCFVLPIVALAVIGLRAEPNIVVWDTISHLNDGSEIGNRASWKAVPTNPFELEADPAKASSDPGYYGQEYPFKGDAAVENRSAIAVFCSAQGKVYLFSKRTDGSGTNKLVTEAPTEITPLGTKKATIASYTMIRNGSDEAILEVVFSGDDSIQLPIVFSFGKNELIEIKPESQVRGVAIRAPIEFGIVPSFVGDDLLFGAGEAEGPETLSLAANQLLMALLQGENRQLVMSWPKGEQRARLRMGKENDGKRPIEAVEFETEGKPLFLAAQTAPGIWHREELGAAYLERDVASAWKAPFPAKWQTQLNEAGVKTRFAFRPAKGTVWRGVPGSYNYPVWFDKGTAWFHLSKKVPAKGEAIIYFLEGEETPVSVLTPADMLRATLGRVESEPILDVAGRKLRTHHRRGPAGTRRACTCGCTEAIQAFFEKQQEVARSQDIREAVDDMIFFVECHVERIEEYRAFASQLIRFLQEQEKSKPEVKDFSEALREIAAQIEQEYSVQKENMKSLEHARELAQETMMLTARTDPKNLSAYMDLLKAWRGMGGAQDYIVAQCHMIARKLFQEAGYAASTEPKAIKLAQEVRSRCREILRNADGYEIWPNY
jgi:hypothetical protein